MLLVTKGLDLNRIVEKSVEAGIVRPDDVSRMTRTERIALIFHPGLSTASNVTDVSGRGVGMDAVCASIRAFGGDLEVDTEEGKVPKRRAAGT